MRTDSVFKDGKAKKETAEPYLHITYIFTYQKEPLFVNQKLWRGELEETTDMTDLIKSEFDMLEEWRVEISMIRNKTISVFNP